MRIAVLAPLVTAISEPQLGGSQALLADLATGLGERGHEVAVFAATGSEIPDVEVVDTGVDPAVLAATLFRADAPAEASDASREAFDRAWGLVARWGGDIVHVHAFDVPAVELAPPGLRVVHTLHLPPQEAMVDVLARARPVVVCVSEAQAAAWGRFLPVDVVLRNGIPTGRIPWSADGGRVALFAGRLSPEKGVREAIEIARLAGAAIEVVGDAYDPAYAEEHVRPLAGPDVRLHPGVARSELWRRMAAASAVLCPVRWDEPFGLVAAEAQAAGTPVVGFRRGGLVEVVRHGVTGHLIDDGDLEAAAEALAGIDRIDRTACRRHAVRTLDLAPCLDAHERLYRRMLAGQPPSDSGRVRP